MPSLNDLLRAHGRVLVIDAAATTAHAGWLATGEAPRWAAGTAEAGQSVFELIDDLAVDVRTAGAFVFCEGPGSILGIRTAAMAMRTWRMLHGAPIFAYRSLDLMAHAAGTPGLTLIVDARRQSWYALTVQEDCLPGLLQRVPPDSLRPPLATPDGFRHWSPLPALPVANVSYDVPAWWERCATIDLLRPAPEPDAFHPDPPTYATWQPQVHQAR